MTQDDRGERKRRTPKRRPRGEPIAIGDLVERTAPGRAARALVVSRALWEEVAGVGFARRTAPLKLQRGILWIRVSSPAWAQELALAEPVVLGRLRARGVEVTKLRYAVGEVEAPERGGVYAPPRAAVERARQAPLPEEALPALSRVRDVGLREVLAGVARALARQRAEVELRRDTAQVARAIPTLPGSKPAGEAFGEVAPSARGRGRA
jgi:hypothetical protein